VVSSSPESNQETRLVRVFCCLQFVAISLPLWADLF